jgi:hypothetical protein
MPDLAVAKWAVLVRRAGLDADHALLLLPHTRGVGSHGSRPWSIRLEWGQEPPESPYSGFRLVCPRCGKRDQWADNQQPGKHASERPAHGSRYLFSPPQNVSDLQRAP